MAASSHASVGKPDIHPECLRRGDADLHDADAEERPPLPPDAKVRPPSHSLVVLQVERHWSPSQTLQRGRISGRPREPGGAIGTSLEVLVHPGGRHGFALTVDPGRQCFARHLAFHPSIVADDLRNVPFASRSFPGTGLQSAATNAVNAHSLCTARQGAPTLKGIDEHDDDFDAAR
jgi:hypothetical protein